MKTREASLQEATGSYRLLLFGCRYADDIQNVVFLDKEGDPNTIEIFSPDFDYKTRNNVPARDAVTQADQFIRCNAHYQQTQIRAILDPRENVVGYEVRPLYSPVRFGMLDVMLISYRLEENRITVYIRLDPAVEAEITSQGGDDESRNGR